MAKKTTIALTTCTALATAILAATAAAQPDQLRRSDESSPPEQRRLIDGVVGIFGDKAILESSIRSELLAQIEGERNAGRNPSKEEVTRMRNDILRNLLKDEALAQGARTMRGTSRQQVDQMVDQHVQEFRREEEERAGSVNQLTEELGILGQTWESLAEERRTDVMASLARTENLRRRYQDSFALAVTPAEMRTYYQTNTSLFVQERSCDLDVIAFSGAGAAVLEAARQAAASWRSNPRPTKEVAAEFGGIALDPQLGVRAASNDPRAPALKEFAAEAKQEGQVSEPITFGNSLRLLRVAKLNPGRHDSFDDPRVQAYIQRVLVEARIEADNNKLILTEGEKVRIIRPQGEVR